MQEYTVSTKCGMCDVQLAGREQFVGHMIHGHDVPFEEANVMWKHVCARDCHNTH